MGWWSVLINGKPPKRTMVEMTENNRALAGLYSSSTPVACGAYSLTCSWATKKSYFFHTNHMLGALDFTSSEHWALFNFSKSTALTIGAQG